jgi:hypothetical protein
LSVSRHFPACLFGDDPRAEKVDAVRVEQLVSPREALLQNLPVRLQGADLFEVLPEQDFFDLLQLEPQLPVEQDLLEGEELRLFVEPVAVRA